MTSRIFAVAAAVLLVGAFALATLVPSDVSLAEGIVMLDRALLDQLHDGIIGHLGNAAWVDVAMPLLVRPVWLVPASLGLICVGGAASFGSTPTPRARRHRG